MILAKTPEDQLPAMTSMRDVVRIWTQLTAAARISILRSKPTTVLQGSSVRIVVAYFMILPNRDVNS
jgi:hypothetical protein